jgi:hypothetical protein
MAMFGMISQLYSHTGLAPQQPGQPSLQGVGSPPLAVTPAPASTAPATSATPETMFSMSALLGSAGRPFSHHCQQLHSSRSLLQQCRQSASPSYHRDYLQGEVERVPCFSSRHSRQLQHLLLQMLSHPLLSRLLLPRTSSRQCQHESLDDSHTSSQLSSSRQL